LAGWRATPANGLVRRSKKRDETVSLFFASSSLRCSPNPRSEGITIPVSIGRVLLSNTSVKGILAISGVTLGLAVLCSLGTALRLPSAGSWPTVETRWPSNPEAGAVAIPFARTNLLIPLFASGWQPQFEVPSVPRPSRPRPPASPGQLLAGVYKTLPYTCIVVVPGPHPDDQAIFSPSSRDYRMPIVRPDLQFIPLSTTNR
jgi:hypothetical protein